ncbi:hypothetical protein [Isoptericola halotolerans]|uniref:Uncharacterized protein n=1 Tax=Isoptericola halotolerans TaxID=300560 RepID=A0ABX2A9C4_9MICO|nr:hypothetical protein [Isoptericola halotolerans]NOV98341.1 hypothetical protein [Isoptericola halotolerans]
MRDDLGFAVPTARRDLASLRTALKAVHQGMLVTAALRTAEHGRFNVSGRVRRDLTDTAFKVGWWDLTTGKGTEPVAELQSLVTTDAGDAPAGPGVAKVDDLRDVVSTLAAGDVVTAGFEFEGCGAFTISGEIRRDEVGTRWVLAGHHLGHGDAPAARLRRLTVERRAPALAAASGSDDLSGD